MTCFVTISIYGCLQYSVLYYCSIALQCLLLLHQSMTLRSPFMPLHHLITMPLLSPTNLWPSTVLLFMLLHHCIKTDLSQKSMTLFSTSFYAHSSLYCNAFCYPTNQWNSRVTIYMSLQHCTEIHFLTPPIFIKLLGLYQGFLFVHDITQIDFFGLTQGHFCILVSCFSPNSCTILHNSKFQTSHSS